MLDQTQSTPPNDTPPHPRRWHWTAWVLGSLVLLVCIVMNLGGDLNPIQDEVEFGWPLKYGSVNKYRCFDLVQNNKQVLDWFRIDLIGELASAALVANLFYSLSLALLLSYAWEWRIRRLKHWLQFSLLDWLIFCVIFGVSYISFIDLYSDRVNERLMNAVFHQNGLGLLGAPQDDDIFSSAERDCPADWIWDLLNITEKARPYRLRTLSRGIVFSPNMESDEQSGFPLVPRQSLSKAFSAISNMRGLQQLELVMHEMKRIPPDALLELSNCHASEIKMTVYSDSISGDQFISLAKVPGLSSLTIQNVPHDNASGIGKLRKLVRLEIEDTGINDETMKQIGGLSKLKRLWLRRNPKISAAGWRELANLQQLEEVHLDAPTFNDLSLAELKNHKELRDLTLENTRISQAGWSGLAKLTQLVDLKIIYAPTFDDETLANLDRLPKLSGLILQSTNISSLALAPLKKMKSLNYISLQYSNGERVRIGLFDGEKYEGFSPRNEKAFRAFFREE